jgi:hypothetical protein
MNKHLSIKKPTSNQSPSGGGRISSATRPSASSAECALIPDEVGLDNECSGDECSGDECSGDECSGDECSCYDGRANDNQAVTDVDNIALGSEGFVAELASRKDLRQYHAAEWTGVGPWNFMPVDTGHQLSPSAWKAAPYNQDAGSTSTA